MIKTMKLNKIKILAFVLAFAVLLTPMFIINADTNIKICDPKTSDRLCNPINANNINDVVKKFLEGALKIGIPFIALAIIYSGFLFVLARGNAEALGKAKSTFMYTLIGAAILLGAWAIAKLISETVLSL